MRTYLLTAAILAHSPALAQAHAGETPAQGRAMSLHRDGMHDRHEVREERREVRHARRELRHDRRELHRARMARAHARAWHHRRHNHR